MRMSYTRILIFVLLPAILAGAGILFPIWTIEFNSPTYGQKWAGISIHALNGIVGPVDQVNIINHYVGLGEIKPEEIGELRFLPFVYVGFVALVIASGLLRGRRASVVPWLLSFVLVVGMLGLIYVYISNFTHNIDPAAPIKIDRVPIPIIGNDEAGNFKLRASIGLGLYLPLIAALIQTPTLILLSLKAIQRTVKPVIHASITIFILLLLMQGFLAKANAEQVSYGSALQDLVDAVPLGGVLHLGSGTYYGPVKITKPITIEGEGYPIVDGRGEGDVVLVTANGVSILGLKIMNSNPDISRDSAGIKVTANNSRIFGNIIENTLFGVYLQGARYTLVEGNNMIGFSFKDINDKGHAVYLWYSFDATVKENNITSFKDGMQIDHSYDSRFEGNTITSSRYGVHLMYSANIKINGNIVAHNLVGMALMYSQDLEVIQNTVRENRGVAVSDGIFVRENGEAKIERNTIYGHMNGLVIESSPYPPTAEQMVANNMIAFNNVGLVADSNSGGIIQGNNFVENLEQVRVTGASTSRIRWSGNFWSDYRGLGDIAHVVENPLEDLMDDYPQLRVFAYSPAYMSLELFKKSLPAIPKVRAIDNSPSVKPSDNFQASVTLKGDNTWLFTALLLTFAPVTLILVAYRRPRVGGYRSYKPNKAV